VVIAAHSGLEGSSYDVEAQGWRPRTQMADARRERPGIDVIFLGHTHRELADTTIAGTLILQARNWAASLAVAELDVVAPRRTVAGDRPDAARSARQLPDARAERFETALAPAHNAPLDYVGRSSGTPPASGAPAGRGWRTHRSSI
jgi:2',3'-cyclic-nucleotide 2'-phosphodiesterase (5'-nucleotidase family)